MWITGKMTCEKQGGRIHREFTIPKPHRNRSALTFPDLDATSRVQFYRFPILSIRLVVGEGIPPVQREHYSLTARQDPSYSIIKQNSGEKPLVRLKKQVQV